MYKKYLVVAQGVVGLAEVAAAWERALVAVCQEGSPASQLRHTQLPRTKSRLFPKQTAAQVVSFHSNQ